MEKIIRLEKATSIDSEVLANLSKDAFHPDSEISGFEDLVLYDNRIRQKEITKNRK